MKQLLAVDAIFILIKYKYEIPSSIDDDFNKSIFVRTIGRSGDSDRLRCTYVLYRPAAIIRRWKRKAITKRASGRISRRVNGCCMQVSKLFSQSAVNCYMHWHAASRSLKSHFWWQCQRRRRYTRKHSRFSTRQNSFRRF